MGGFGSFLADKLASATAAARDAAHDVANWTVERAAEAQHAIEGAKAAVVEQGKTAVAELAAAGKAGAQQAGMAKEAVKTYVHDKVQAARDQIGSAVDAVLGRKPAVPLPTAAPGVQACPMSELQRKTLTRQARQALIDAGRASGDPALQGKADELKRDMEAADESKLANHIYCIADASVCDADNGPVTGFKDVSRDKDALDQIGLKPDDLNPPGTGFRAAVFERQTPPFAADEAGYVVVFKGTTPGSLEDWRNNTRQGLDVNSPYYKQAVSIGKNVAEAVGQPANPAVSFAGHSLGGGLASAAAQASGLPANTFNAAGLNAATVARYGASPQAADIFAYHVPGDPLTQANVEGINLGIYTLPLPLAAGTSQEVARAAEDATIPPGLSDTYFHSMPVVTRAIEKRKSANEDRLNALAAAGGATDP